MFYTNTPCKAHFSSRNCTIAIELLLLLTIFCTIAINIDISNLGHLQTIAIGIGIAKRPLRTIAIAIDCDFHYWPTLATRFHKYFQGLSRLLLVPGVLVSFLDLSFLGKMKLNKWYRNFGTVKIFGRQRGIFVIVCGICRGLDKKQFSKWHNWPKKPRKCCTKI